MAIETFFSSVFSFRATKRIGLPNGLGRELLGITKLGYRNDLAKIYQNRTKQCGHPIVSLRHYRPTNPRTEAQQANRTKFANAMTAWQNLTDLEKKGYIERARRLRITGHNLFIREYMLNTG